MINNTTDLKILAEGIRSAGWVGIDTEADSLHAYPEKLCLIQIAIPGTEVLIDPLGDLHLEPLWTALDQHELIFHAADYDLRLMATGHHFRPTRMFDTMWASRLLGDERFGLNDVLTKYLGITLEKGAQKANWGRRPLTERMVTYALNDVRHLHPLREVLREKLTAAGRHEWHQQVCDRMIADAAAATGPDPDQVWRIKGHDKLEPLGLAILRELWHWREKDALRAGKPPFFILPHEQLSMIAGHAAAGPVGRPVKLPPYLSPRRRQGILDAIKRGHQVPAAERPKHERIRLRRMTRAELEMTGQLRDRRDKRAAELGIDPTLIASKATLYALARQDAVVRNELLPWQRELLAL
ncbi:MAG TPA: HRDC domain-containing protein [Candidatus Limnocylindria bacterium]|nr:HRDC domain-containing protein [Candidatus Limnocylindria bacterium]